MPNVGVHLEQRAMSLVRPLCRRRQHLLAGEEEGQVPQQENKEDKSCVLVVEWLHGDGYVEREPRRRYMSENLPRAPPLAKHRAGTWNYPPPLPPIPDGVYLPPLPPPSARASQANPASQLASLHDPF